MVSSGADIQTENGFVKIHPAILDLLAKQQLSGREFRCLLFLFRMTYGYRKKADTISLSQWAQGTGIPRTRVGQVLETLVEQNLIFRIDQGVKRPSVWGFNKHFETWQDGASVTLQGDSLEEKSVTLQGDSLEPSVTLQGDKSVTLQGDNHRYKEKDATGTALASLSPGAESNKYGAFVTMLEQVFAITISPGYADFIAEWVNAVNEREWVYALGECKARKGGQFLPKYVASILRRVVAERTTIEPADVPVVVNVTKLEADAWPI